MKPSLVDICKFLGGSQFEYHRLYFPLNEYPVHCPNEGSCSVKQTAEYKSLTKTVQNVAFSRGSPLSLNGGGNMKIRMHCGYCNRHDKNKVGGPDMYSSVYRSTLLVGDRKET